MHNKFKSRAGEHVEWSEGRTRPTTDLFRGQQAKASSFPPGQIKLKNAREPRKDDLR